MSQISEWNEAHGIPRISVKYEPEYEFEDQVNSPEVNKAVALNNIEAAKFQIGELPKEGHFSYQKRLELINHFLNSAINALKQ